MTEALLDIQLSQPEMPTQAPESAGAPIRYLHPEIIQHKPHLGPEAASYLMERGSYIGQIAANQKLLDTIASAKPYGIVVSSPDPQELRASNRRLRGKLRRIDARWVMKHGELQEMQKEEPATGIDIPAQRQSTENLSPPEPRQALLGATARLKAAGFSKSFRAELSTLELLYVDTLYMDDEPEILTNRLAGSYEDTTKFDEFCLNLLQKLEDQKYKRPGKSDLDTTLINAVKPNRQPVLGVVPTQRNWRDFAKCKGEDTEYFFPQGTKGRPRADGEEGEDQAGPKAFCKRCEVRNFCLDYALEGHIRDGIWGGTGERERLHILRIK